jgi:integrase
MKESVSKYLDFLRDNRNATPSTLKNYRSTLSQFSLWLGERMFDQQAILEYLATIPNPASANVVRARLVGYAHFHDLKTNKVVRKIEPRKTIEALTSEQLDSLIKVASLKSKQLAAVIIFLSETGLRFQEFLDFKHEDIQTRRTYVNDPNGAKVLKTFHLINVIGKGRKSRVVALSRAAFAAIPNLPHMLTLHQQQVLRNNMAAAGREAGIHIHVHPHLLRASFISIKLNEMNREAIVIAKLVGHSSVDTMLNHYYSESSEKLYDAVDDGFDIAS